MSEKMTEGEAIGHIKDIICENNAIKPNITVFEQEKEALYMAIEALKYHKKWIPITERLPKKGEIVMASTKNCVYPKARFTEKRGWEWDYETLIHNHWVPLKQVTAWMPLPAPYIPVSEVEE